MIRYEAIEERLYSPDTGWYIGYGIRAYRQTADCPEAVLTVSDISLSREQVTALAERCTKGQLAPIHLKEVIDDFLCQS